MQQDLTDHARRQIDRARQAGRDLTAPVGLTHFVSSPGREPKDASAAAAAHVDGPLGFYLATDAGDAAYFATRREAPAIIRVAVPDAAVASLCAQGAQMGPIPRAPDLPKFTGKQLSVPASVFGEFERLRGTGEINVRP